jgi:hypothetical protein
MVPAQAGHPRHRWLRPPMVQLRLRRFCTCATVMSHAESVELFTRRGTKYTPELDSPSLGMPSEGYALGVHIAAPPVIGYANCFGQ